MSTRVWRRDREAPDECLSDWCPPFEIRERRPVSTTLLQFHALGGIEIIVDVNRTDARVVYKAEPAVREVQGIIIADRPTMWNSAARDENKRFSDVFTKGKFMTNTWAEYATGRATHPSSRRQFDVTSTIYCNHGATIDIAYAGVEGISRQRVPEMDVIHDLVAMGLWFVAKGWKSIPDTYLSVDRIISPYLYESPDAK